MSYRIQCGLCNEHDVYCVVMYVDDNLKNKLLEGIVLQLEITGKIIKPYKIIN